MKRFIAAALAALVVPIFVASTARSATTSETTWATDIASGTYTQSELSSCAADSVCTDLLFGPNAAQDTGTQSLSAVNAELSTAAFIASPSDCPNGSTNYFSARYWTQRGTLGNVNYRWHWAVWFCRNNTTNRITKWIHKADWLTNAAWYVNWTNDQTTIMVPSTSPFSVSIATAYRSRHVQLQLMTEFVPINYYPHGKFYIVGDGTPTSAVGGAR